MLFQVNDVIPHTLPVDQVKIKILGLKNQYPNEINSIEDNGKNLIIDGSHFNVTVIIDDKNITVTGTEDLIGRLAESAILRFIKDAINT